MEGQKHYLHQAGCGIPRGLTNNKTNRLDKMRNMLKICSIGGE